jgi:type I restriction enzyme S subunit
VTVRLWGKGVVQRREVAGAEIAARRRLVVHSQQFILSRIDARNGAFGLVPDSLDGAVVSNDFPVFSPNPLRLLPSFLGWMSKTSGFVDLCMAASEGTTNRIRLKEDRFLATQIPLPPIAEQRRIVARIEELAAKIDEARNLRRQSVQEADALARSATHQILRSSGEYREVPLESVCADIIDNLHSNPVYAEEGVPCVRSPDVGWGELWLDKTLRTSEEEYIRRTGRGEPQPDDIVLVREGGGTGKAAIVKEGQRFSLGQRVMLLRPDKNLVQPKFLLQQLLSPAIHDEQVVPLLKGSASPHLNIGLLRKLRFLLPSLSEQGRIVIYLDSIRARIDALKCVQTETRAELDALLPSILYKAFKGDL